MRWLGLDWDEGPLPPDPTRRTVSRECGETLSLGTRLLLLLHQGRTGAAARSRHRRGTSATIRRNLPHDFSRRRRQTPGRRRSRRLCGSRCPNPAAHFSTTPSAGRIEFANTELEDFVLLRSDGGPTYHLSVVTDDVDMRITHVIRGADHISNTPKQVLALPGAGGAVAGIRARASDPWPGQNPPQQAPRRHQRDFLSR